MVVRRHALQRDGNEPALFAFARDLGVGIWPMHEPTDCLAAWRGQLYAPEIKLPERAGRKHEYTEQQIRFRIWCRDHSVPFVTWRTEDDVLTFVGARRTA